MASKPSWWLITIIVSTLLSSWPNWLWLLKRLNDGSDEPWGIVAMITFIALLLRNSKELHLPSNFTLTITALFMLSASLTWGGIPPIFVTGFAVLGLAWLLSGLLPSQRSRFPLLILALLTLPLAASLNFYLGYPLRWFCAQAATPLLATLGLNVTPQGTALIWNGKSILIDAPCAGIAMLWLGIYLATLFSFLNSSSLIRSLINLFMALTVVILANVVRNTLLFFKESGIIRLPHWTHEAIGLMVFGLMVVTLYKLTSIGNYSGDNNESP